MKIEDYSALTSAVSKKAIQEKKRQNADKSRARQGKLSIFIGKLASILGYGITYVLALLIFLSGIAETSNFGIGAFIYGAILSAMTLSIPYVYRISVKHWMNKHFTTTIRLRAFADRNNLTYYHATLNDYYKAGIVFQVGESYMSHASNLKHTIRNSEGVEIGLYSYRPRARRLAEPSEIVHTYIQIPLKKMLPHIIIDSKSNNFIKKYYKGRMSNINIISYDINPIKLGGEFGERFNAYCSKGYESDVYYMLTPDIMELIVKLDNQHPLDIELVDNLIMIYFRKLPLESVSTWKHLEHTINTLKVAFEKRTAKYSDYRIDQLTNIDPLSRLDNPYSIKVSGQGRRIEGTTHEKRRTP